MKNLFIVTQINLKNGKKPKFITRTCLVGVLKIKNPKLIKFWVLLYGAPGEIRTPDPLVRSQVLYPTELRVQNN